MTSFTPYSSLAGGILIGLGAALLLLGNGRVAGITGIFAGVLARPGADTAWRALFLAGLVGGALTVGALRPGAFAFAVARSPGALVAAGLLVGFGTRLGNGCTSGHGLCGLGRRSLRSLVATGVFMATAMATVLVVNRVFGGVL